MPRVAVPQGPIIHLSTDRKAVECVVAMAAAVSACVTFLPYQTLTQSGVKEGGNGKKTSTDQPGCVYALP